MKIIKEAPSKKSIYFWNITGSFCNAMTSVLLLMFVTRILTEKEGDIFSIAWAIAQLLSVVGTFQIRLYQATDIKEVYTFSQYVVFRKITIVLMIISSIGYILIKGYDSHKAMIILMVCLYKIVDVYADVYQGWFQQKERLDLAGKALTLRVIASSIVFGVSLWLTENLLISCFLIFLSAFIFFLCLECRYINLFDIKKTSMNFDQKKGTVKSLVKKCLPLFINGFLTISILNASKMAIDTCISEGILTSGTQTYYSVLFMPAFVINLFLIVFRPLITQLAIFWNASEFKQFNNIIKKILVSIVGVTILAIVVGSLIGIPVLSSLYSIKLHKYSSTLAVIIIGGGFNAISNILDNAMTVIRKQHMLVVAYGITWLYATFMAKILIKKYGIFGAGVSFMTAMGLLSGIILAMLMYHLKKEVHRKKIEESGHDDE